MGKTLAFFEKFVKKLLSQRKNASRNQNANDYGADYEARTRYLHLGKVALYQMS